MFLAEVPDACSVNIRKKAKTKTVLPSNCGFLDGRCGDHQLQRVVEAPEKQSVGDFHAYAVTCHNTHHQTKLQAALWQVLKDFEYHHGYPDPDWAHYNEQIVFHTLLRRRAFIDGSLEPGSTVEFHHVPDYVASDLEEGKYPGVSAFLSHLNGDWRKRRVQFWTAGRDISREQAMGLIYASCIDVDFLHGRDDTPSMDDWGSTAVTGEKVTLGVMCHNLAEQCLDIALPTWGDGIPPNDRKVTRSDDSATAFRIRVQKKAWRTRCFLQDGQRVKRSCVLSWMTPAVEHLSKRLAWLDGHHNGLLDLCEARTDPFRACRKHLHDLVTGGARKGSPLSPLFWRFCTSEEETTAMLEMVTVMGTDMGSQIKWRFLALFTWPFTMTKWVHPAIPKDKRDEVPDDVFRDNDCCVDEDCTLKVRRTFKAPGVLRQSGAMYRGVKIVAFSFPFTDLDSERQLSRMRKSVEKKAVEIEKMSALAHLSEILTDHLRCGEDPRITTRAQLLEDKVPIKCAPREATPHQGSPWLFYLAQREVDSGRTGRMLKHEYDEWRASVRRDYDDLPSEFHRYLRQEVHVKYLEKLVEEPDVPRVQVDRGIMRSLVDRFGNQRSPITVKHFEAAVRAELGCEPSATTRLGFTRYDAVFRAKFQRRICQRCTDDIPEDQTFTYALACPIRHPGLCARRDQVYMPAAWAATKVSLLGCFVGNIYIYS